MRIISNAFQFPLEDHAALLQLDGYLQLLELYLASVGKYVLLYEQLPIFLRC